MSKNTIPDPNTASPPEASQIQKSALSFKPTDDTDLSIVVAKGENSEPAPLRKPHMRKKLARSLPIAKLNEKEIYQVYFEDTFFEILVEDLEWAKGIIIIHCPFLKDYRLNLLLKVLERCVKRGVRVCVFIREPKEGRDTPEEIQQRLELAAKLLRINVHVTIRPDIHEKLIIIDEMIFWEGSCNSLSQAGSYERIPRWISRNKVLEAIESHGLLDCRMCFDLAQLGGCTAGTEIFGRQLIGRVIRRRRMELGISQRELAELTNIAKPTISRIEHGRCDPKLSTIEKICIHLRVEVRLVSWHLLSALDEKINLVVGPLNMRVQKARRSPWQKDC